MIAIIDYDAGNIRSVGNALQRLGAEYELTADPARILAADKVILPGVGNAAEAMAHLRERGLCELIRSLRRPVLGICVGMQLMCRDSEEGPTQALGIFDAHVRRFTETPDAKVPHMGWNALGNLDSKLFKGTADKAYRSRMNVTFVTGDPDSDAAFVKAAAAQGLVNLKGHRLVGGIRASIYNAMPVEGVKKLADFMKEYEAHHV